MRQPRALRCGLQAVRTLRRVLWQQQSLEAAFEHSKAGLPAYEHGTLRDLCSGTLRHWHLYAAVIDSLAPPTASDDARLLMATTLYEGEHVRTSPGVPSAVTVLSRRRGGIARLPRAHGRCVRAGD